MFRKSMFTLFFCILLWPAALQAQQPANDRDPELNFEYVWKSIDRHYAQFDSKHIDWGLIYRVYRPKVTAATSDGELWDTLLSMLRHLNDAHVCLADQARRSCGGQNQEPGPRDFSLQLVKAKYLTGKAGEALKGRFSYGWLAEGIGYIHMADHKASPELTAPAIDAILGELKQARALVLDVRDNPGGTRQSVELVANRFADRKRNFMTVQIRYGSRHSDLWPADYRHVKPEGPWQFTGPTILLTNRNSASGADIFTLAMRVLPQVTVLGDVTEGALSAQFPDRMPNGWTLWVSFKLVRDEAGVCWDGVGVPPDLSMRNSPADVAAGRDRVLELALQLVQKDPPGLQDESASLKTVKTSLVEVYQLLAREQGVVPAIRELKRLRTAKDGSFFFSPDELMQQAQQYLGRKQFAEARGLLQACREDFPQIASAYSMLALACLGLDDVAAAEEILRAGETVPAGLALEPALRARAIAELRKRKLGSAAQLLKKALAEGGLEAGEKALASMLPQQETGPVFEEAEFNSLGYQLLQDKQVDAALFVFEQASRLFPGSWNAFDSLGEALAQAGRKRKPSRLSAGRWRSTPKTVMGWR